MLAGYAGFTSGYPSDVAVLMEQDLNRTKLLPTLRLTVLLIVQTLKDRYIFPVIYLTYRLAIAPFAQI
jgi:hypothetical protein